MNERLRFVIGQKRRILNEITSRLAKFKLDGKNGGVFVTLKNDGSLDIPKDFIDEDMPILRDEYTKLSKKEKQVYDDHYHQSTTYLISNFNEANKKYKSLFNALDVYDKIDTLKEELNNLVAEQRRANIYFATLNRQSEEKRQNELNKNGTTPLTDKQILEINQEITQIKYIDKAIEIKSKLMQELKDTL